MPALRPRLARITALAAALAITCFAPAAWTVDATFEEHVTGGVLDLAWTNGFGVSNNMQAATLDPGHPAYNNPSGDHTVAVATNSSVPDSGGIILTAMNPAPFDDNYQWSGWIFTGDGNTRRGLVVRAQPSNGFTSCYQFVIQSGLFQINFRKLNNGAPFTMKTWFATQLPAGSLPPNTWHKMEILAVGNRFQCWLDGFELTSIDGPAVDDGVASGSAPFLTGWAGVYNFRFDLGGVPFYTDDLELLPLFKVPVAPMSMGQVKQRWAH